MKIPNRSLLVATLICGLFTGCTPDPGPATNVYLRSYEQVSSDLAAQLQRLPKLAAPKPPVLALDATADQRREFAAARREYPTDVIRYSNSLIERCVALTKLYGGAQQKFASLSGANADPDAVQLTAIRVKTSGQRREFFIEIGRLAELNREALMHRQSADQLDEVLVAAFDAALNGREFGPDNTLLGGIVGLLRGTADAVAKRHAETVTISDEIKQLRTTGVELEHDIVEYRTARTQLVASVKAKYPNQDWTFLAPR